MKTSKNLGIGLATVMMIGAAQAASLYWDPNGATAEFGSGGTWGTDAFWTADDTGAFSDGGSATTTAGDNVQVNSDADGSFEMGVSGDVHAYNIVGIQTVSTTTINGPGTIHLYASGGDLADALFSGGNDLRVTMNPDLVLEATVGSTVYLANQGGNNSNITLNGSITSTNMIDLVYADIGTATIGDASSSMDLQGGSFIVDQGNSFRIKNVNMLGVIGNGVTNVTMTSPLGGHGSDKGRLILANAGNAYTGDTTLDDSRLQITTDTSLPDTTTVYITGTGIIELNNPDTNIVAGLFLGGEEQDPGIYNASSDPTWFLGTGSLTVIPEPGTMSLLGLVGLGLIARRRRCADSQ